MNFKSKSTILMVILSIMLFGCYPDGPEYYEDLDVVLTYFNDEYEFASTNTYARPDKIVMITGNLQQGDDPVYIPDVAAALILAQIDKNMLSLGYQKVEVSANPDLLLTPAAWETTSIVYWYDYWYWWWGAYYPGWGYYPGYVSSYSTGTLIMGLIDPTEVGANGNPVVQWTGAINGLLTGSYNASRLENAIDKAFSQSPYLKTN